MYSAQPYEKTHVEAAFPQLRSSRMLRYCDPPETGYPVNSFFPQLLFGIIAALKFVVTSRASVKTRNFRIDSTILSWVFTKSFVDA